MPEACWLTTAVALLACSGEHGQSLKTPKMPDAAIRDAASRDDGALEDGPSETPDAELGPEGSEPIDTGVGPETDAAPAPEDASIDALLMDAADTDAGVTAAFSLLALADERGVAGVRVFYQNASGALLRELATDEMGYVRTSETPAMVTILISMLVGDGKLLTVVAPPPGQQLVVGGLFDPDAGTSSPPPLTTAFEAKLSTPLPAGTQGVLVLGPCSATFLSTPADLAAAVANLQASSACIAAGKSTLSVARDANSQPLAAALIRSLPDPTPGQIVPVQFPAWLLYGQQVTLSVAHAVSPTSRVEAEAGSERISPKAAANPRSGTPTFLFPAGIVDALRTEIRDNNGPGSYRWLRKSVPYANEVAVDVESLPAPIQATTTGASGNRPVISWQEPRGPVASATVAQLSWLYLGGEGNEGTYWEVVAPAQAPSFQARELPADVSAAMLAGNTRRYGARIGRVLSSAAPLYPAFLSTRLFVSGSQYTAETLFEREPPSGGSWAETLSAVP